MAGALQPTASFDLRRGLKDLSSDELLTLADQVDDLSSHPAYLKIKELLETGAGNLLGNLKRGAPLDASEYAKQLGYLAGLEEFDSAVLTIKETAARVQADLDQQIAAERELQEA